MTQLSSRQIRTIRKIGAVVDELSLRNAAAGRAIEAVREQRRRLQDDIARIDRRVRDEQLELSARPDAVAIATLKGLRAEQSSLREQVQDCEQQIEETMQKRDKLNEVLGPWSQTLDAVLGYARVSRAAIGIPFGSEVPPSFQPHAVISERPA